ncbi:MAG: hypothetical protein HQL78_10895 [Magnetococcales bacterium]|nr:hypothetical protein [Magnetococcales bacterium]
MSGFGQIERKTQQRVDWQKPENNHCAIAEEMMVTGENTKRPDIVFYVNGIAVGVLELNGLAPQNRCKQRLGTL